VVAPGLGIEIASPAQLHRPVQLLPLDHHRFAMSQARTQGATVKGRRFLLAAILVAASIGATPASAQDN
jgi:hypothetical protein